MNKMIKIFVFISFFVASLSYSQQEPNDYWKQRQLGIIQQTNVPEKVSTVSNIAQIQQIGNYNYSNINIQANKFDFNVIQNGNNNEIDIRKSAINLNEFVVQNGNNNTVIENSFYSYNVNSQVTQYGNNNEYLSYGSNSISDNLKIHIKGNDKTVIVFSR